MVAEHAEDAAVTRHLDDADRLNVQALLAAAAHEDGFWPMSDQLVADLADDLTTQGAANDQMRPISVLRADESGGLAGYAQASRGSNGWTIQVVVDPAHRSASAGVIDGLVRATLGAVTAAGGGHVDWWLYRPTDDATDRAAMYGFRFDRDLLQMRRALPAARRARVMTRPFVVGDDEEAWLAVNNRAFAGHAEQGTWTIDTLRHRMAQPWFDSDGFRLHEREGRLAAFCWTKRHDAGTGEIYVIGVDPDFQGLGLGKELTLAGLDHLVDHGATDALLYVDGANVGARAMYERLGFSVHRTDRSFSVDV